MELILIYSKKSSLKAVKNVLCLFNNVTETFPGVFEVECTTEDFNACKNTLEYKLSGLDYSIHLFSLI